MRIRVLASAGLLAGGCAAIPTLDLDRLDQLPPAVELESVPFHAQLDDHCGPASLLTVLEASGVEPGFEAVSARVYVPDLGGSLQAEMLAAARAFGRIPYRLAPDPVDVFTELAAGRPVLILQNLGVESLPFWHYAVVIGFDRESNRVILRSGDEYRLVSPAGRWLRQWHRAGRWAVVLLQPGELPAAPERSRLLRAVADFEAVSTPAATGQAWRAVSALWPDEPIAWLGIGNAAWGSEDLEAAERAFERVLALEPGHNPARYNLARVLEETGRACAALELLAGLDREALGGRVPAARTRLRESCREH